jgi:GT2 family glycosyltransferase
MNSASVTAIIVAYNSVDTIDASLGSVRKAHETGLLECFVVDNASRDGTAEFVAGAHPWVTLIESGENLGYGRGCNLALRRVRTPYVLFMNADAMIEPEDVLTLVRFLETHPRAGMAAPALIETDGSLQGTRALPTPLSILAQAAGANGGRPAQRPIHPGSPPFEAQWLCGAVLLADRALLEELGGFDPRFFLYFEETDLCRRVRAHGRQLWAVGGAVAKHAAHDSAAKTQKEMYEGCIAEYYFPSRFYYLAKQYGWTVAAATEAGELALLAGRALVGRIARHPNSRFAQRLRAPFFRAPKAWPSP